MKSSLVGKTTVKKKSSQFKLEPQKPVTQSKLATPPKIASQPKLSTPPATPKHGIGVQGITCVVCGSGMFKGVKVFDKDTEEKLKILRKLLHEITNMTRSFEDSGLCGPKISEFTKASEDVKTKIDHYFDKRDVTVDDLKCNMGRLRVLLQDVKKTVQVTDKSPHLGKLCQKCAEFEKTLNQCCCFKETETKVTKSNETVSHEVKTPHSFLYNEFFKRKSVIVPKLQIPDYMIKSQAIVLPCCHTTRESDKISSSARLIEFEKHVNEVIAMTNCYKQQGLLTPSVTEFLESCKAVKFKIANHKIQQENKIKLRQLKENVAKLEAISCLVQREDLDDTNIMSFMVRCRQFKEKLEGRRPYRDYSLEKLVNEINDSIILTNEVKKEGLDSECVDDYIKSCEAIKAKLTSQETLDKTKEYSKLDNLIFQITNILSAIKTYKDEGIITKSVDEFYKTCLATKAKLDQCKRKKIQTCECAQKELKDSSCDSSKKCVTKKPSNLQCKSPPVQVIRCHSEAVIPICHSNAVLPPCCPKVQIEPCRSMTPICKTYTTKLPVNTLPQTYHSNTVSQPCCAKVEVGPCHSMSRICKSNTMKLPVKTSSHTPGGLKVSITENRCQKDGTKPCLNTSKNSLTLCKPGKSCEQTSKASKTSSGSSFLTRTNSGKSLTNVCESCFAALKKLPPMSVKTHLKSDEKGYYEKQISKTKTIKRFREKDGTIKKSCETVVTKKKKYDSQRTPTCSDVFDYESSYDSVKSATQVNLCEIPQTKGYIQTVRPVKSETLIRTLDLSFDNPIVWSSISEDSVIFKRKNEEEFFGFCDPYFCATTPNSRDSRMIFPI